MNRHSLLLLALLAPISLISQVSYTANNYVRPYDRPFRFGANFDHYPPWTNQQMANIAFGNPAAGAGEGIGLNSFRGSLRESFLEEWGYDIRVADYQHFANLGADDNLTHVGYPSEAHRDTTHYCPDEPSLLFANMYEPIWDGGANGTPVNEDNHYALYLWKMVNLYKPFIKTWEVWNEPDFPSDPSVAYAQPGTPGNWWENNPDPCGHALKAPIFHYVRLLRISWEVIKTADSTAYVCIGGVGNPAFLDAVLRNSDNPSDGSLSAEHPLKGGAYFDVMSFHSYPHLDGSMWEWLPNGELAFHRHSDRGVEGLLNLRDKLQFVLQAHGYDGSPFPEKHWMVSETNLPRKPFGFYIGSEEAQANYLTKLLMEAKRQRFIQLYLYILSDFVNEADATSEYHLMGLLKNLSAYTYPDHEMTPGAQAWKTTALFLSGHDYHGLLSSALGLPANVGGGVFTSPADTMLLLWAKTTQDSSEQASATLSLAASMGMDTLYLMSADYAQTGQVSTVPSNNIPLGGSPVFLQRKPPAGFNPVLDKPQPPLSSLEISPNPAGLDFRASFSLNTPDRLSVRLFDARGQLRQVLVDGQGMQAGQHSLLLSHALPAGIYWLELSGERGWRKGKMVVFR